MLIQVGIFFFFFFNRYIKNKNLKKKWKSLGVNGEDEIRN